MKRLLIPLFILFLIPIAGAWTCEVHTDICNRAGLSNLDCCWADTYARTAGTNITSVWHHCAMNQTNCSARIKAMETDDMRIRAHLLSDSECPVHWFSFNDSSCHYKYETNVRDHPDQAFTLNCTLKDRTEITIAYDATMLDNIAQYVANNMNVTLNETSSLHNIGIDIWVKCQMILGRIYIVTSKAWNDTLTWMEAHIHS